MSAQTAILVAIGLALMLVAAVYGLGSATVDIGDETISNLSDRADEENVAQSSTTENLLPFEKVEEKEITGVRI